MVTAQEENATEISSRRARQVLENGLRVLGGMQAISGIKNFSITETRQERDEIPDPNVPGGLSNRRETAVVDLANSRLYYAINHEWKNYVFRPTEIVNGNTGYYWDLWHREAAPLRSPSVKNYQRVLDKLPQFYLQDVLKNRVFSLRWLGESSFQGRKQNVITFISQTGKQTTLYFDAETNLLTKSEFITFACGIGDTIQEYIYSGYRKTGDFLVPAGLNIKIRNEITAQVKYEKIEFDKKLDDALFELPKNVEVVSPSTRQTAPPYTMTQIEEDVYLVEGAAGFSNVLVVAFKDFVLVVEAPEGPEYTGASERVMAKIKEMLPDKPIKYLAFTHHHPDHACGAGAYIAEGTTIITTPGNKQYIENLATAKFSMSPVGSVLNQRQPVIEFVENKKKIISDEKQSVEFYDIGPYWHAKEELIVYLPKYKLLFEGDLFTNRFADGPGVAQLNAVLLAQRIKILGLDVKTIIGVHQYRRPVEELYRSIEKRRQLGIETPETK